MSVSSKRILRERNASLGLNGSACPLWLLIGVMAGVTGWIWYRTGCLAGFIGAVAALGAGFCLCSLNARRPIRALAAARRGESICRFARSFNRRSTDPVVIRAVFERLGVWIGCRGFPVRHGDRVFDDLRMDGMDFEDLVDEVAALTGRPLANMESNPYYGCVCTAGDLVRFFMHQAARPSSSFQS
jgi:hypothetical protein